MRWTGVAQMIGRRGVPGVLGTTTHADRAGVIGVTGPNSHCTTESVESVSSSRAITQFRRVGSSWNICDLNDYTA